MSLSLPPSGSSKSHGSRTVGDYPDLGQVSKMRPGFDPRGLGSGGTRRRRSSPAGDAASLKVVKRIVIVLGVMLLAMAVSAVVWVFDGQKKSTDGTSSFIPLSSDAPDKKDSSPPVPKELVRKARQMVEAKRPADLPDIVRLAGRTPEALLEKLAEMAKQDGEVSDVTYIGPMQNLTQPLEAVLVAFVSKRNRIVLFSPDSNGDWMIDFDAYARATSLPWDEILSGKNVEATVRVYVSLDSYYNGRFSNEDEWSCNGMASPDEGNLMFGYAKKGSNIDQAIRDSLKFKLDTGPAQSSRMLRMTLQIRHQEGDDKRQFEIVRVIADDWGTPQRPLEDHYQTH
jgi:hypothetical protein